MQIIFFVVLKVCEIVIIALALIGCRYLGIWLHQYIDPDEDWGMPLETLFGVLVLTIIAIICFGIFHWIMWNWEIAGTL